MRTPAPPSNLHLPLTRRTLLGGGAALGLGWAVGHAWGHRPLASAAPSSPFLGSSARATLEAALEALLPASAPIAALAADVDAFVAGGDPVVGGQLVVALRVLEHAGGAGLLRFSRFSRIGVAERARVLQDWRRSRFATKRRIADAVRRIALFSWYAHPDSWEGIGYDGPLVAR